MMVCSFDRPVLMPAACLACSKLTLISFYSLPSKTFWMILDNNSQFVFLPLKPGSTQATPPSQPACPQSLSILRLGGSSQIVTYLETSVKPSPILSIWKSCGRGFPALFDLFSVSNLRLTFALLPLPRPCRRPSDCSLFRLATQPKSRFRKVFTY